jgi:hypothetical protein
VTGVPNSKTRAAIRKQYPIVVKNLLSDMRGAQPSENYDGYSSCPLITEIGKTSGGPKDLGLLFEPEDLHELSEQLESFELSKEEREPLHTGVASLISFKGLGQVDRSDSHS